MSVIICKHCGKYIDTDFDVEHEEICGEELKVEETERKQKKAKEIKNDKQ